MAKPSRLTGPMREEIGRRLAAGESLRALGREFRIPPATMSDNFTEQAPRIRNVATALAIAEADLRALPVIEQRSARTLADQLKDIESSYASGAASGARSADRLHGLADRASARLVQRADEEEGLDPKDVALVSALHQTANQGAVMASNMLAANKAQAAPALPVERPRPDLSKLTKKELAELERLTRKAENV